MKQRIGFLILTTLLSSLLSKEIDITRGQFWGRITVAPQFENGFGAHLSAGMRDNLSISKEVDGEKKPSTEQGNWLNELYLGASWKTKLGKRTKFITQLTYRPQFWYPDRKAGSSYLRNTVMSSTSLFHSFKNISLHQRATLWGLFSAEQDSVTFDNELIVRYLLGPEIKFAKRSKISLKAEPFFKVTADGSDVDGTELFNRFYTWVGYELSPLSGVKLVLNYVNMHIYQTENKHITDHTFYAHVIFAPKWR